MFKKPSITTRVRMAVAVPAAVLVIVAVALYPIVQSFRIGGPVYNSVRQMQNMQVDTAPSALVVTQASGLANELFQAQFLSVEGGPDPKAQKVVLLDAYSDVKARFTKRRQAWTAVVTADKKLKPLLTSVMTSGAAVLTEIDTNLLPNLTPATAAQARTSLAHVNELHRIHQRAATNLTTELNVQVATKEHAARSSASQRLAALLGLALLAIVGAVLGSQAVMRSLLKPVDELTQQASRAAYDELPALVAAVNAGKPGAEDAKPTPFPVHGNDEFTQLAIAMNAMQDTAVNMAVDQARSRRGVSESLINLGRRNQGLLARTLTFITELEQNERNPETLTHLFRLDHLTTRMRRNAESLLVLAGSEPPRIWTESVALSDIIRAALSEIESYGRVDLAAMDPSRVKGTTVSDIAHLCAELMENATNFSPPSSRVVVLGRATSEGYLLSIRDNGIGMTQDEIDEANRVLANTSTVDATPSKVLGHYVVSKLAARHGIEVALSPTIGASGVTADVFIPNTIIEASGSQEAPRVASDASYRPVTQGRVEQPQDHSHQSQQPHQQPHQPQVEQPQQPQWAPSAAPAAAAAPASAPVASVGPDGLRRRVRGAQTPNRDVELNADQRAFEEREAELRREAVRGQAEARGTVLPPQQAIPLLPEAPAAPAPVALAPTAPTAGPVPAPVAEFQPVASTAPTQQPSAQPVPDDVAISAPAFAESAAPALVDSDASTLQPVVAAVVEDAPVLLAAGAPLPTRTRGSNWRDETPAATEEPDYRDPQQVRSALSSFQAAPYQPAPAGWVEPSEVEVHSLSVDAPLDQPQGLPQRRPGATWAEPAGSFAVATSTPSDPDVVRATLSGFQTAAYAEPRSPQTTKDQ
jgi:signal transduction histidine kinase